MTDMEKLQTFKNEIYYIQNKNVKDFVCKALLLAPDYFYEIPASTTGKYHPEYSLGEGGLVRHTKAAVRIFKEMIKLEMYRSCYTEIEQDCMIAALILHDTYKCGKIKEQYTRYDHPIIAAEEIAKTESDLDEKYKKLICDCIRTHMGEWIFDNKNNKVLEKPSNKYQKFVHFCDYLASRKCLDIKYEMPLQ